MVVRSVCVRRKEGCRKSREKEGVETGVPVKILPFFFFFCLAEILCGNLDCGFFSCSESHLEVAAM
jgi:hypothetical protein